MKYHTFPKSVFYLGLVYPKELICKKKKKKKKKKKQKKSFSPLQKPSVAP